MTNIVIFLIVIVCLYVSALALVGLSLLFFLALQLALADSQGPILHYSRVLTIYSIVLRPGMDSIKLLLDEIALALSIFLGVSVSGTLIVLSAVVDPNLVWDEAGTHLVAAKDVGNGFA